jgi:hypothetical protein
MYITALSPPKWMYTGAANVIVHGDPNTDYSCHLLCQRAATLTRRGTQNYNRPTTLCKIGSGSWPRRA